MVLIGTESERKETNRWKHGPRVEDMLCIYSGFLPVVKSASGAGPGLTPLRPAFEPLHDACHSTFLK